MIGLFEEWWQGVVVEGDAFGMDRPSVQAASYLFEQHIVLDFLDIRMVVCFDRIWMNLAVYSGDIACWS